MKAAAPKRGTCQECGKSGGPWADEDEDLCVGCADRIEDQAKEAVEGR